MTLRIPLALFLGLVFIPVRDVATIGVKAAFGNAGMLVWFPLTSILIYSLLAIGTFALAERARVRGAVLAAAILYALLAGWHVIRGALFVFGSGGRPIASPELLIASEVASMTGVTAAVLLAIAAFDRHRPLVVVCGIAAAVLWLVRGWIPFVGEDFARMLSRKPPLAMTFSIVTGLAVFACLLVTVRAIRNSSLTR